MATSSPSPSLSPDPHALVFSSLRSHFSAPRISTELELFTILRSAYPAHSIVCTSPCSCDLLGYAKAGHASASVSHGADYDASRNYRAPRTRSEGGIGVLKDHVRIGRWDYDWEGEHYVVYEIEYSSVYPTAPTKLFYVLHLPASRPLPEGQSDAIDRLLLACGRWSSELHNEIYVFDDSRWRKDRALYASVQGVSWDSAILDPATKRGLIGDVASFFASRALYAALGVPWKRGLILHGTPGNGKTLSIKALINSLQHPGGDVQPVPSLYVKSLDDQLRGPKHSIRAIFQKAREMAPCLLIFEDLDSLVTDKTRSYFLNEVDGLESNEGICMIGSTNHLETLDPAIVKRPSRFDRKYHFKLPGEAERRAYCESWREKLRGNEDVEWTDEMSSVVAQWTDGFSFAYLKELFLVALLGVAHGSTAPEESLLAPAREDSRTTSSASTVIVEAEEAGGPGVESSPGRGEGVETKQTRPEMAIPASLRDNVLLAAICAQITLLRREMETVADSKPDGKKVAQQAEEAA
jgi:hypothetical protein